MASNYRQRSGDRYDGRIIHTIPAFSKLLPFIMKTRSDAQCSYEQAFGTENAEAWLEKQRDSGYGRMSFIHLFLAAYIRCVAALPAINRFVSGRRIYARDSIEVIIPIRRSSGKSSSESAIKVEFEPTDTVYDVYNKLAKAIEELKSSEDDEPTVVFAEKLSKLPRFAIRFIIWLLGVADHFSLLPKKILDASPFHGSVRLSDYSSSGTGPITHRIYNFGNLPLYISLGAKRKCIERDARGAAVERGYIDAKFTFDERCTDTHNYAAAFRYMAKLIAEPEMLEVPPETVKEDVF